MRSHIRIGHFANAPGAQPFYRGQQPLVILMAGFAAAQVCGHSGEPAFRARSVELSFGVAVQYVERYIAPRIPRVCGEQIIQPEQTGHGGSRKARKISSIGCQAGTQDAARFEQRAL